MSELHAMKAHMHVSGEAERGPAIGARHLSRRLWVPGLIVAAALTEAAAWLTLRAHVLSPDEAGFLFLAQHWHRGHSLYGDYWVDRPPVLLWLFDLAQALAPEAHRTTGLSAPGVGVLGAAAATSAVVLAGALVTLVTPSKLTLALVLATTVGLMADPLLGMPDTNGEVLALPFVLAGIVLLVAARRTQSTVAPVPIIFAAGAAAMTAFLVKQNEIDVFVVATVLLATTSGSRAVRSRGFAMFAAGVALAGVLAVVAAAARGTSARGLWDAVVMFRLHASFVIGSASTAATSSRAHDLALAAVASGLIPLIAMCAPSVCRRRARVGSPLPRGLGRAALALTAWEAVAVAAGGSYWTHYLTGLVPGVVLLLIIRLTESGPKTQRTLAVGALVFAVIGAVLWARSASVTPGVSQTARVETFLRTHAGPRDQVTTAFGDAAIVAGSGLGSPYEYLWSLPVRVRDPHLSELTRVLTSPSAPRWMVVSGPGLSTWGVDATVAQRVFDHDYQHRATFGTWQVFERHPSVSTRHSSP